MNNKQLAMAATLIAADLIQMGMFGHPAVYINLDRFALILLIRGNGIANGRLLALVPWFAAVEKTNGVGFCYPQELVHGRPRRRNAAVTGDVWRS